jgi:two-component system cell cycle sensor histidine kinase/response regulator CckA
MQSQNIPYVVLLITSAVVSAIPALFAWRHRSAPGKTPFIFLMLAVTEWSLGYAFQLGSASLHSKIFWAQVKYLGIVIVPAAWLSFALQYTMREKGQKPRNLILLAIEPFITLLLVWTNHLHGLIWSSVAINTTISSSLRVATHGAWFWVHAVYSYSLLFLGAIFIIQALIHSPHRYRGQISALLMGVLIPWVGNALYIYKLSPIPNLDLTPFTFTLAGGALAWSLFRFRLLDILPAAHDAIIKSMSDGVIVLDAQDRIVDLNPAAQRIIGHTASEIIGQPAAESLSNWSDLFQQYNNPVEAHSEIAVDESEVKRYFDLRISPLNDRHGHLNGRLIVLRDITARKHAEEALKNAYDELEKRVRERTAELVITNEHMKQEVEERKRAEDALQESLKLIGRIKREWESTADSLPQLVCLLDERGCILRTNRTVEKWNIERVVNVKGRRVHELFHPRCNTPSCYLKIFWSLAWEELTHGQSAECEAEDKVMKRYVRFQVQPIAPKIYREGEETDSFAVITVYDITEQKQTEKEIAALEEQLRQAQKMEAIGRLAGGIAHDFNNLLTPIGGYAKLAMAMLSPNHPMYSDIQEIQKAAERAATLTRQLATFTRRQPLNPQVVNLNDILLNLDKMLRRLIGEHIKLVTLPAATLGFIKVDPSQFEQVLVNLAVNARDAMPDGGKLILETSNVTLDKYDALKHTGLIPGDYILLAVSDTGIGMTKEVKAHLFEPFFTTKEKGKGTGLGLSTCYGIIQQSGGYIWAYSEQGQGTTIKIYLPRVDEAPSTQPRREKESYLPQGSETVLLVEDEPLVRKFAYRVLHEQGYTVLEAVNGDDALRVAQEYAGEEIHLLLTDVVMPQMGGKELADQLKLLRSNIKVLFTSGYTDNAIVHQGVMNPGFAFLEKPFSPADLVYKVREVLDS